MKEFDLENVWASHREKIDSNVQLNDEVLMKQNFKNARWSLNKLLIRRVIEGVIFILLTVMLLDFILSNHALQYVISGGVLAVFSMIGLIGTIVQVFHIFKLNFDRPVTAFQLELEKLRLYSLQTLRLLFLSIPFYLAYIIIGLKVFLNFDIFSHANTGWLVWNIVLSVLLVPVAVYLYKQLRFGSGVNWLKKLIADNGGRQIDTAIHFVDEIIAYRKD